MAGIVASTLRRRTIRHKLSVDTKYQAIEPGHICLSPTASRPPSRSPSLVKSFYLQDDSDDEAQSTHVHLHDLWPTCENPSEQNLHSVRFETFDTLVPKANLWIQNNMNIRLVRCETIEKKVCSIEDVTTDEVMFVPKGSYAIYVKGLRLWYFHEDRRKNKPDTPFSPHKPDTPFSPHKPDTPFSPHKPDTPFSPHKPDTPFSPHKPDTPFSPHKPDTPFSPHKPDTTAFPYVDNGLAPVAMAEDLIPMEIGYMNVIPKCLDSRGKYPVYENLPETYAAVNAFLTVSPLEGKILSIETVPLKLPRRQWQGPEVDPDKTYFPDEYLKHVLYITRIYFIYGQPVEDEHIGMQDFLPDFVHASRWYSVYGIYPRYRSLVTAMHKAKDWIQCAKRIRITNIQTLEAVYRKFPENVKTGANFIDKVESNTMLRFVRVTYVRPQKEGSPECVSDYCPPEGFSYKTFVPSAIKVGMCSGSPTYESLTMTWERAKVWQSCVERRVIGVETFYHPMSLIWHQQDGGETTILQGEWTTTHRGEYRHKSRRELVQVVRLYLDGDYTEPPEQHLPPAPPVEEVNDCRCTIQ